MSERVRVFKPSDCHYSVYLVAFEYSEHLADYNVAPNETRIHVVSTDDEEVAMHKVRVLIRAGHQVELVDNTIEEEVPEKEVTREEVIESNESDSSSGHSKFDFRRMFSSWFMDR